jgi:DNA-binding response OmpR family regulator
MSGEALLRANVILVDVDAAVRQALSLYLETLHGCHVTAVADLKSLAGALATMAAPPALLIADLKLAKGESGIDAVHATREFYGQTVPALLLTGDCSFSSTGLNAIPALRVLTKPFDFDVFSAALDELVLPLQSEVAP